MKLKKHIQTLCFLVGILTAQTTFAQDLFEQLQELKKSESFEQTKQSLIREVVTSDADVINENQILACGYLQLKETMDTLRSFSGNRTAPRNIRIASYKSLARMGDENALVFLISQVERNGMNDDVVAVLLPDLIYTQQRPAFDLIIAGLYDDTPRCTSSNPDNEAEILCGYRIMEMLAPVIKDFPLELEASGDIKTKSYEKALQTLRKWFEKHKTDYVILTEDF
ncbi:MAG: hypothetical protein LBU91_00700 [Bacteroidales bacterium]|jgi:hypothetical protein|nr:hypothetical protein [Bacteroidales bacterium]